MTAAQVEIVKNYMAARIAGDVDTVASMVSDDIVLVSERDGTKTGKTEFIAYIKVCHRTPMHHPTCDCCSANTLLSGVLVTCHLVRLYALLYHCRPPNDLVWFGW
jgi:ketosteroid isomerase-like protein